MSDLATVLIALAAAIVTGGTALLGVYLTNRANTERLKNQLDHDTLEKSRVLKRERAEELYELTDEWLRGLFFNYLNLSFVMQGKFDYNQYLDQIIKHGNSNKSNFTRLEMILRIYFSNLVSTYEEVTRYRTIINDIAAKHKRAYEKGDFDGGRFLESFTSAQLKLEEAGDNLKDEIARCARDA